jgi:hypothetical protein
MAKVVDDTAVALMTGPACTLALTELMMARLQLVDKATTSATGVIHVQAPADASSLPSLHLLLDDIVPLVVLRPGVKTPQCQSWLNEQTIDCMVVHQPIPLLSTRFSNGVYLGSAFSSSTLDLDEQLLSKLRGLPPKCRYACLCREAIVAAGLQFCSAVGRRSIPMMTVC